MKKISMLVFAVVIFISGCATTPNMGYTTNSPEQARKNISIQVMEFTDQRLASEKGKLGARYNQYGMKAGDVLEPQNLMGEIHKGFLTELERAGYNSSASASEDLTLKGEILALSCDQTNNSQSGTVKLRLILTDKGHEVLNTIYSGDSKVPFTFDGTCSDAFNDAVKKPITTFVKDLDQYIKS